jgi:hypothetical protein
MGIYTLTEQDVKTANAKALAKFDEISAVLKERETCSEMFSVVMDAYTKVLRINEVQTIKLNHYENA